MKRIIASVLAAALLLLPLCSCSSVQHIEDTNGAEDTSLCTLTEEELVSPHPKCLTQGSSISHYKNMVYFLPLKMSGVKTLDKFTVKAGETYEFTGAVTVNSGNVCIYVICDGKIVLDIPTGLFNSLPLSGVEGKCELRAAAESAKFSLDISIYPG